MQAVNHPKYASLPTPDIGEGGLLGLLAEVASRIFYSETNDEEKHSRLKVRCKMKQCNFPNDARQPLIEIKEPSSITEISVPSLQPVENFSEADVSWVEHEEAVDTTPTPPNVPKAKPKGKAKFIGQSETERAMAVRLMEAMKPGSNGGAGGELLCRICQPPRKFTAATTLASHYRSHAGIKPYRCRLCQAAFTRRHSLNYHLLIHANATRFTCQDCGRKFRHPSHFREHRRRHTGEAPFECPYCSQRFRTRNTFKSHIRSRHGGFESSSSSSTPSVNNTASPKVV